MKSIALVLALSSLSSLASVAMANDCTALYNELYGYTQFGKVGGCQADFNAVKVKITTNRNDGHYASYSEAFLTTKSISFCQPGTACLPSFLSGDALQQFSDRSSNVSGTPSCPSNTICPGYEQNFSVNKSDILGVKVQAKQLTLTLKSWGNGNVQIPVSCSNSMMYGEKDGTFYVASFQKTIFDNICIK